MVFFTLKNTFIRPWRQTQKKIDILFYMYSKALSDNVTYVLCKLNHIITSYSRISSLNHKTNRKTECFQFSGSPNRDVVRQSCSIKVKVQRLFFSEWRRGNIVGNIDGNGKLIHFVFVFSFVVNIFAKRRILTVNMDYNNVSLNHFGSNNKLETSSDQNGVIQPLLTGLQRFQSFLCLFFVDEV